MCTFGSTGDVGVGVGVSVGVGVVLPPPSLAVDAVLVRFAAPPPGGASRRATSSMLALELRLDAVPNQSSSYVVSSANVNRGGGGGGASGDDTGGESGEGKTAPEEGRRGLGAVGFGASMRRRTSTSCQPRCRAMRLAATGRVRTTLNTCRGGSASLTGGHTAPSNFSIHQLLFSALRLLFMTKKVSPLQNCRHTFSFLPVVVVAVLARSE